MSTKDQDNIDLELNEAETLDYSTLRAAPKWRKRRRKSTRDFLLVFSVVLFVIALIATAFSPLGNIAPVEVIGNKAVTTEEVLREAHIVSPANLLRIDTSYSEQLLKKDLRIADAKVARSLWPPKVTVTISENAIMAYIYSNYGVLSLDKNAGVIAAAKSFATYDAPIITGIKLKDEYVGENINEVVLKDAVKFLAKLDSVTNAQISEVRITSKDNVTLILNNGMTVVLGDFSSIDEKARYLKVMLKEISEKNLAVVSIDLRYNPPTMRVKNEGAAN